MQQSVGVPKNGINAAGWRVLTGKDPCDPFPNGMIKEFECPCPTLPPTAAPPAPTTPPPPKLSAPVTIPKNVNVNLITIDTEGNMQAITVVTPSLQPIGSSYLVMLDDYGNTATITPGDVYQSYPKKAYRLLVSDKKGNFSIISSFSFNPCYVYPDGHMNGSPQGDGTCTCASYWASSDCSVCGYGTSLVNGACHYALRHGSVFRLSTNDYFWFNSTRNYLTGRQDGTMDIPFESAFLFQTDPSKDYIEMIWQPAPSDPTNPMKGMIALAQPGTTSTYPVYVPFSQNVPLITTNLLPACGDNKNFPRNPGQHGVLCISVTFAMDQQDSTEFAFQNVRGSTATIVALNGFVAGKAMSVDSICGGYPQHLLAGFGAQPLSSEALTLLIEVKGTDGNFYPIDSFA